MNTMFDTLLQLPLFQGLAYEDLTNILEKVKLHFIKHKAGKVLIKQEHYCQQLLFVIKGEIACVTTSTDKSYTFTECHAAPYVIEPQALFGMNTNYVSEYQTLTEVHTVSVSKDSVIDVLFGYNIFCLNYMNMVSNRAQVFGAHLWNNPKNSIEDRIVHFILSHLDRLSGEKRIRVTMSHLSDIVSGSRAAVSKALNDLQDKGALKLHRGEIVITEAEKLSQMDI